MRIRPGVAVLLGGLFVSSACTTRAVGPLVPCDTSVAAAGSATSGLVGARLSLGVEVQRPDEATAPTAENPNPEVPAVGTHVYLADAGGNPLPGMPTGTTGANGQVTLTDVPAGVPFEAIAPVKNRAGQVVVLKTLVKPTESRSTVSIDLATTLATEAVTEQLRGQIADLDPLLFQRTVERLVIWLRTHRAPDLGDRTAVLAWLADAVAQDVQLREALTILKVVVIRRPSPGPVATSAPIPTPSETPRPIYSPVGPQVGSVGTFDMPYNLTFDAKDLMVVAHSKGVTMVTPTGSRDFGPVSTCVGVAVDVNGTIYASDADAKLIRSIGNLNISTTLVTGATGGSVNGVGSAAAFFPWGMALDPTGNLVFADRGNHCIRRLSLGGVVTNVAGTGIAGHTDGPAATAQFSSPMNVAYDHAGNLFVTDADLGYVRKITPDGQVSTVAQVPGVAGVAVSPSGTLFVSSLSNVILKVAPDGTKSVYTGSGGEPASNVGALSDGPLASALFFKPFGLAFSHAGDLYVADTRNARVRRIK